MAIVADQFYKIKLCPFQAVGYCRKGSSCTYAHSEAELRIPISLQKTKICVAWKKGECQNTINCPFAHGELELRSTPNYYKTGICRFWGKGTCEAGENCRHAHGVEELKDSKHRKKVPFRKTNKQRQMRGVNDDRFPSLDSRPCGTSNAAAEISRMINSKTLMNTMTAAVHHHNGATGQREKQLHHHNVMNPLELLLRQLESGATTATQWSQHDRSQQPQTGSQTDGEQQQKKASGLSAHSSVTPDCHELLRRFLDALMVSPSSSTDQRFTSSPVSVDKDEICSFLLQNSSEKPKKTESVKSLTFTRRQMSFDSSDSLFNSELLDEKLNEGEALSSLCSPRPESLSSFSTSDTRLQPTGQFVSFTSTGGLDRSADVQPHHHHSSTAVMKGSPQSLLRWHHKGFMAPSDDWNIDNHDYCYPEPLHYYCKSPSSKLFTAPLQEEEKENFTQGRCWKTQEYWQNIISNSNNNNSHSASTAESPPSAMTVANDNVHALDSLTLTASLLEFLRSPRGQLCVNDE